MESESGIRGGEWSKEQTREEDEEAGGGKNESTGQGGKER